MTYQTIQDILDNPPTIHFMDWERAFEAAHKEWEGRKHECPVNVARWLIEELEGVGKMPPEGRSLKAMIEGAVEYARIIGIREGLASR